MSRTMLQGCATHGEAAYRWRTLTAGGRVTLNNADTLLVVVTEAGGGTAFLCLLCYSVGGAVIFELLAQRQSSRRVFETVPRVFTFVIVFVVASGIISGVAVRIALGIISWVDQDPYAAFTLFGTVRLIVISVLPPVPFGFLYIAV